MTITTYIAVLHDGPTPTNHGQPVLCALQPNGAPKPLIDHNGTLYRLINDPATPNGNGVYDYHRDPTN